MLKVGRSDIKLGEALPYSVYDKNGVLLLKAGFVITLQRHRNHLIENGLYANEEAVLTWRAMASSSPAQPIQADTYNTFESLDLVKIRLQRLFGHCKHGKAHEDFTDRIYDLALAVQEACAHDTDSALANLHLDYDTTYPIIHHLQAALLCELIAKKLAVKEEDRLILVSAALTHDLGLLDIQDSLEQQLSPLTPLERVRIDTHPSDTVRFLERLGVANRVWLEAVRHHHERLDGSGYPDKLTGDGIRVPSRILAIADIYSAMVRDRPYRKALVSKEAMRSLLLEQGEKVDHRLIQMMIKEVGVFPPGAIVKLTNGDVGVVKQRQANTAYPIVYAFMNPDGRPMLSPMKRDTSRPEHNVVGILPFSDYKGCAALIRGLWIPAPQ